MGHADDGLPTNGRLEESCNNLKSILIGNILV